MPGFIQRFNAFLDSRGYDTRGHDFSRPLETVASIRKLIEEDPDFDPAHDFDYNAYAPFNGRCVLVDFDDDIGEETEFIDDIRAAGFFAESLMLGGFGPGPCSLWLIAVGDLKWKHPRPAPEILVF